MTFKELAIGDCFVFESERRWWSGGMAKGPWRKVTLRGYNRAEDIYDGAAPDYCIGSVSAAVVRMFEYGEKGYF